MKITKEMTIGEILKQYPDSAEILMSCGMGCVGCPSAQMEKLEEAVSIHGIDLEKLLLELNANI